MDWPEFHRLAERELNEAAHYYHLENPGLGSSFLQEVERCLQSIEGCSSSPPPPISVRALVQDQAKRHSDSRSDESHAASYVLGGTRLTRPRPGAHFVATIFSHISAYCCL